MSRTFVTNQIVFIFSSTDANRMLIILLFFLNANVKIIRTVPHSVLSTCSTPSCIECVNTENLYGCKNTVRSKKEEKKTQAKNAKG